MPVALNLIAKNVDQDGIETVVASSIDDLMRRYDTKSR